MTRCDRMSECIILRGVVANSWRFFGPLLRTCAAQAGVCTVDYKDMPLKTLKIFSGDDQVGNFFAAANRSGSSEISCSKSFTELICPIELPQTKADFVPGLPADS